MHFGRHYDGHHFGGRGFRHRGFMPGFEGAFDEGRGGRRRLFDSGELRLVLLKLLSEQPRHGYDLIRAIEELTGGSYAPSPGVIYPTLTMLEDIGHIAQAAHDDARKAFAITAQGQANLDAHKTEVEAILARLADLKTMRQRTDGAPVRRAMQNLRAVLMHRLAQEDAKPDTLHDVAAILDEAARRIERL